MNLPRWSFGLLVLLTTCGYAAEPNLKGEIDRPLRYRPDGRDFVIENGAEFFNRSLYGGNTAFRVDAGDRPEVSLYLPGRGGNLRLGIKTGEASKWLHDAESIVARYRAGTMVYEIRDPIFGGSVVKVTVAAATPVEAMIARIDFENTTEPMELICAYGGANGERGRRGGDIGAERQPVREFFRLRPEYCRENAFELADQTFTLRNRAIRLAGIMPAQSRLALADATKWTSLDELLASAGQPNETPVLVARCPAATGLLLSVQRLTDQDPQALAATDLPQTFEQTIAHLEGIAARVTVDTPDPFINAAASALCIAADGIWDEPGSAFMHGAVAWRSKLLGWRGVYSGDALGWHDRTRRHLANWFDRQNVSTTLPATQGADPDQNLARSERLLHSTGDLTNSHYDMNLVAIDALFRHLLWTGDREYAKQVWPVIERHLAWERRLFRREFGPDKLPLYEGYACIWASDDLQYHGGGATHSTAYNYWHNVMAARVAEWIEEDPRPCRDEAELIRRAMKSLLWLPEGWYAEFKDLLGLQRAHPSAAVWTHYHAIDSRAADPFQAWQMGRYLDTQIPHIPVQGAGVPSGHFTRSTTNWMPYLWSINNVVMAETMHTSLADWQASRIAPAFNAFKGAILDSMYLGLCPGNVGMCSGYDVYRRESQRDFADGVGAMSRALVEGLFGIVPDALAGELLVCPGFPESWDRAAIRHPNVASSYNRAGNVETFLIEPKLDVPMRLRLRIAARATGKPEVTVNARPVTCETVETAIDRPMIDITSDTAERWEIVVRWQGEAPIKPQHPPIVAQDSTVQIDFKSATVLEVLDPQQALADVQKIADIVRGRAAGPLGHRTVFAKTKQGELSWWIPVEFEIRPRFEIVESSTQDPRRLRFRVRNNTPDPIDQPTIAPFGQSEEIAFDAADRLPGTNRVSVDLGNRRRVEGTVTNWKIAATDSVKFEPVDLSGVFNDSVTQIFRNEYLSPRSPYCSLAIPINGLGAWASNRLAAEIDDTGLRRLGSSFKTPQGIPFNLPGEGRNIAFVSQWDNYPRGVTIALRGNASHVYLLLAGSTNHMQCHIDNGEVVVTYTDDSIVRLPLRHPTNWWPIEQDLFIDDFALARPGPVPPRVDLKTGAVRVLDVDSFKGKGGRVPGGAGTLLDLPLDSGRELKSIELQSLSNEVVIGMMGVTLVRP